MGTPAAKICQNYPRFRWSTPKRAPLNKTELNSTARHWSAGLKSKTSPKLLLEDVTARPNMVLQRKKKHREKAPQAKPLSLQSTHQHHGSWTTKILRLFRQSARRDQVLISKMDKEIHVQASGLPAAENKRLHGPCLIHEGAFTISSLPVKHREWGRDLIFQEKWKVRSDIGRHRQRPRMTLRTGQKTARCWRYQGAAVPQFLHDHRWQHRKQPPNIITRFSTYMGWSLKNNEGISLLAIHRTTAVILGDEALVSSLAACVSDQVDTWLCKKAEQATFCARRISLTPLAEDYSFDHLSPVGG